MKIQVIQLATATKILLALLSWDEIDGKVWVTYSYAYSQDVFEVDDVKPADFKQLTKRIESFCTRKGLTLWSY